MNISRRTALTVAGAATVTGAMPALVAAGSPDAIIAMFAERNRLYFEWGAAGVRLDAEDKVILAKFPPQPVFPKRTKGADFDERRASPEYRAWSKADKEWNALYGAALHRERAVWLDAAEKDREASFDTIIEISQGIIDTAAVSQKGLAIKLWVACDFTNLGDDWEVTDENYLCEQAALVNFHDACRIHDLTVMGYTATVGGGLKLIGSRRGEPVNEDVS